MSWQQLTLFFTSVSENPFASLVPVLVLKKVKHKSQEFIKLVIFIYSKWNFGMMFNSILVLVHTKKTKSLNFKKHCDDNLNAKPFKFYEMKQKSILKKFFFK